MQKIAKTCANLMYKDLLNHGLRLFLMQDFLHLGRGPLVLVRHLSLPHGGVGRATHQHHNIAEPPPQGFHLEFKPGINFRQCCESGSEGSICFWASRIRIH